MADLSRTSGRTAVLLSSASADVRTRLSAAISGTNRFAVVDLSVERSSATTEPVQAGILDIGDGADLGSPAIALFRERLNGAPFIVLSQALSPETTRQLLRLGAADWLQAPFTDAEIIRTLDQISQARTGTPARVVTFIPAAGGAGATTMTLLAAGLHARSSKTSRISVVDLDFQSANCAAYLNSRNDFDIGSLVEAPERLDLELAGSMKREFGARSSLYSFERHTILAEPKAPQFVLRLLDVAAASSDTLFVDLPNLRTPWFLDVVKNSDLVFIVSYLNVPSLARARRLISEISEARGSSKGIEVIINRTEFKLFGNVISRKDVERGLNGTPFHTVADDPVIANEAINRGLLLTELAPRSKLVRDAGMHFSASINHQQSPN